MLRFNSPCVIFVSCKEIQQYLTYRHEYDSDEDIDDGGTWEHKQRTKEMEKTKRWADDLTQKAKGKHHIGDFLPPEELAKFMEKVSHHIRSSCLK